MDGPSVNPRRKREAQGISGIRVAFSLGTFFWRRKRKYLGCRSENRLLYWLPSSKLGNRALKALAFFVDREARASKIWYPSWSLDTSATQPQAVHFSFLSSRNTNVQPTNRN
jgi:hypothetical protein